MVHPTGKWGGLGISSNLAALSLVQVLACSFTHILLVFRWPAQISEAKLQASWTASIRCVMYSMSISLGPWRLLVFFAKASAFWKHSHWARVLPEATACLSVACPLVHLIRSCG